MKKLTCIITCIALLFVSYTTNAQSSANIKAAIEKINSRYYELFKNKDMAIVTLLRMMPV